MDEHLSRPFKGLEWPTEGGIGAATADETETETETERGVIFSSSHASKTVV